MTSILLDYIIIFNHIVFFIISLLRSGVQVEPWNRGVQRNRNLIIMLRI